MKSYFCFLFLLCSITCYGYDTESQRTSNFRKNIDLQKNTNVDFVEQFKENNEYHTNEHFNKYNNENSPYQKFYGEEYIGNPDVDAEIERPSGIYDLNCIRRYFAKHSKCKISRGPLPTRFFIGQESLYFTTVNMTATPTNFVVDGFRNTRIEEFYINRRTNKMVFAIQVRSFSTRSSSIYFQFYRSHREPIVIVTEGAQTYPSVTFTAIIPNINDLQLNKAEITAYADTIPAFILGPELLNNTDPTVTQALIEFVADLPRNTQEAFLTDSQFYLPAYIQFNICDFGLSNL